MSLELDWDAALRADATAHGACTSCPASSWRPVTGGNIAPDKARLDFDIDMSLLDAARIERETNALIARAASRPKPSGSATTSSIRGRSS